MSVMKVADAIQRFKCSKSKNENSIVLQIKVGRLVGLTLN